MLLGREEEKKTRSNLHLSQSRWAARLPSFPNRSILSISGANECLCFRLIQIISVEPLWTKGRSGSTSGEGYKARGHKKQRVKEGDSNLFHRETTAINSQATKIVTDIASFFFTLQSSVFWHFKMPKRRCLMTVNIKKIDRVSPGFDRVDQVPGRPGFSGQFPSKFLPLPGPVPGPGRPAGPVQVLKLCYSWILVKFNLSRQIHL